MSLTLRAALSFRSRVGPKAGLAVLRPLIDQLAGVDRAHAILAALECARALGDEATYGALTTQWAGVGATGVFETLAAEVGAARAFSLRLAQELAHSERIRSPGDARAHYLLARVSDGDLRAASYDKALLLASRPPVRESHVAQIVASMIVVGLDPGAEHVSSLSQKHVAQLCGRAQIAIAEYRLGSTRGYKRVAALDGLLERVGGPDGTLALTVLAEFAERARPTALEWDRLSTMAQAAGEEAKRRFDMWRALRDGEVGGSTLAQEAKLALSSATETVRLEPAPTLDPGADAWAWSSEERRAASAAYAQILRLRAGDQIDVAPFIDNASTAGGPALALCALGLADDNQAPDFARFAEALIEHSAARCGWLRLSEASRSRGQDALTTQLLERAFECGERGAARSLGAHLRSRAWVTSDADEALALMSRARQLLRGPLY